MGNILYYTTWCIVLSGYKNFYSESKVNKADGVIMYIKDAISKYTEIIVVDHIRIVTCH